MTISRKSSRLSLKFLVLTYFIASTLCQKVILFGSSGVVGSEVLKALTKQTFFKEAILVGRNFEKVQSILEKADFNDSNSSATFKIMQVSDLNRLDENEDIIGLRADACIITVGVAHPYRLNLKYWHSIEVDMVASIARFCNKSEVKYMSLLSSVSAEKEPTPFSLSELEESDNNPLGVWGVMKHYDRLKALEENEVIDSARKESTISLFQASTIVTREYRYGFFDRAFFILHKFLNPILPSMWHSVDVRLLGMSMAGDAIQKLSPQIPSNASCSVLKNDDGGLLKIFRLTYNDYLSIAGVDFENEKNQDQNAKRKKL